MNERMARMDIGLFAATLLMLGFGLVLVYSSSFALAQQKFGGSDFFLSRQAVRALFAVIAFTVFINIDYHVWGKLSKPIFYAAIALLAALFILPGSHEINGARRWIALGPLSFQVSDFARMALIILLARMCEDAGDELQNWKVLVKHLLRIGIICVLIIFEPNFSTAVIIGVIGLSMLFMSGARLSHVAGLVLSVIPVCMFLVLRTPYRRARLMGYMELAHNKSSIAYQTYQSLIGLGNGGIFGVGLGKGEQKYFYLPEPHTDFIFSILGEEIGFIGLCIVIAVFVFIIVRGFRTSMRAPDRLGQLMAFGFTMMIAIYVLIHTFVNTGLIPTTGVPLPFLSYGGMSLIFTMSAMGILLNISSQSRMSIEPLLPANGMAKAGKRGIHQMEKN